MLQQGEFASVDLTSTLFYLIVRRLNSRLKQLGARELVPMGLGDDQSPVGFLGTFDLWIENLATVLLVSYTKDLPLQIPPQYYLSADSPGRVLSDPLLALPRPQGGAQLSQIAPATVTQNVRISRKSWSQNLFHLSLALPSSEPFSAQPPYRAGDVLVVYPPNPPEAVDLALSLYVGRSQSMKREPVVSSEDSSARSESPDDPPLVLLLDETTRFEIGKTPTAFSRKNRLPSGLSCSLRDLFSLYLDITATPHRSYFEQLSFFATASEEADKLLELSTGEGADLYQQYCAKERRGYIEILSEFKSCHVPLEVLIGLIPPLHPRYYSIASAGLGERSHEVQLCVALVEYVTPLKRRRAGLCSTYLSQLSEGSQVICCLRRGSFPEPKATDPLILIGPGTGLAPMRAFIQQRYPQFSQIQSDYSLDAFSIPVPTPPPPPPPQSIPPSPPSLPSTVLFYGCRSGEDDFLYKQEWQLISEQCSSQNIPLIIKVAHSRKGTNHGRYVTHDLTENGPLVWRTIQEVSDPLPPSLPLTHSFLEANSRVYVSGSASTKMPSDVRKCLVQIITSCGDLSKEEAERWLLKMEREKRYCVEAWS
jgi:sulfite reductase alpha subunit-like flavoprotein